MHALILASAALTFDPPAEPPPAVAMVVFWSGKATLSRPNEQRALRCYDRLRPGDKVAAGADSRIALFFPRDGHKDVLHANSQAVVRERGVEATGKVERVESKLKEVDRESLREAMGAGRIGGATYRNNRSEAPLIMPVHGAAVATDRPVFRWPAVAGAVKYRVTLQTSSGQEVWHSESAASDMAYPSDQKPLLRGRPYFWSVTAILSNDDEQPRFKDRKFIVGSAGVAQAAERIRPLAASADPADRVLAAAAFESLGLYDELYPLYSGLTKTIADDAKLWMALACYAELSGRKEEAASAAAKAKGLGWSGDQ